MNKNRQSRRALGKHLVKSLIVVIVLVQLNGCGFKLRSAIDLPESMKKIYVEGASAPLQNAFKQLIRGAGGHLVSARQDAGIIIKFLEEEFNQRTISLDASGNSTEIELNYYAIYELRDAQDKILVSEQTIDIARDYFDNQVDVIAKNAEGDVTRGEIYQEAVHQIINKFRIKLNNLNLQP